MKPWHPTCAPMTYFSHKGKNLFSWLQTWMAEQQGNEAVYNPDILDIAEIKSLIIASADNSPYLCQLIEKYPEFLIEIFTLGPDICLANLMQASAHEANIETNTDGLKKVLRRVKSRLALLTAFADLGGAWSLNQVTAALSNYADLALQSSLGHLLWLNMQKNRLPWPDGFSENNFNDPQKPNFADKRLLTNSCGYVILALGKLGGGELNYSSDIDLIALYNIDTDEQKYPDHHKTADIFVKITRDLIEILSKRTADGYVFRTDFRLRPDPSATPLALSLDAAESYYQSIGQNWERSAMIKARVAAGDNTVGADFLERMKPFIWRRNLDFAAIADIHAIKSQVHAFHLHQDITLKGHDLKIGYGGIREIEFLAQIQQLIYGGRAPELRLSATRPTLLALEKFGRLSPDDRQELDAAYVLLRTLEHRLQMINDEQTHQIPHDDEPLAQLAAFSGFASVDEMEDKLTNTMHRVAHHFAALTGADKGSEKHYMLEQDPTGFLQSCGFENTGDSVEIIHRWRTGRYRALRTPRAIALFEQCLPELLRAFSQTSNPVKALARFDSFLSTLPAGVQLFSLFDANPWLFKLIARIMGSAPLLAEHLAKQPALLDTLLDPQFFNQMPEQKTLEDSLNKALEPTQDYEDFLDASRHWLSDRRFEVGVHILEGTASAEDAEHTLTQLADIVLSRLIPRVEDDFKVKYGTYIHGHFIVLAMGSYGSEKLTFTSDLDMVFLYHLDNDDETISMDAISDHGSLSPSKYYSRLGQHIITAITARTAAGNLYELDMRLRPSGRSGPLVVATKTFENYQMNDAWVWEHMALTKTRIIYGNKEIKNNILNTISNILVEGKKADILGNDIVEMHQKLADNFSTNNIWDLRNIQGGFVDIEFVLQYLILLHAPSNPQLIYGDIIRSSEKTTATLKELGLLSEPQANILLKALKLYNTIHCILRLSYGNKPQESEFSNEICSHMAKQCGKEDFQSLKAELIETTGQVYELYQQVLGQAISKKDKMQ